MFKRLYLWFVFILQVWRDRRRVIRRQNHFYRPKARRRYHSRLVWRVRQLFPLVYWTTYHSENERRFAIWKMWFGRCYRVTDFPTS